MKTKQQFARLTDKAVELYQDINTAYPSAPDWAKQSVLIVALQSWLSEGQQLAPGDEEL